MSESGFKLFSYSYNYEGKNFSEEIMATSFEDARARLARMPFATVNGIVAAKIPAEAGPLVPIVVRARNVIRRWFEAAFR